MSRHQKRIAKPVNQWPAALGALLATLLAAPAAADIQIPDDPLTTGSRVAPNILFVLDDSGSMNFVAMPIDVKDANDPASYGTARNGLNDNPTDRSYLNNTIYYDPNVNYEPWVTASGDRMSGGTAIDDVYSDWNHLTGSRDLRDSTESVFYVPKPGVVNSTNARDFDRYWVRRAGSSAEVVRLRDPAVALVSESWSDIGINSGRWEYRSIQVPSGATSLQISVAGGEGNRGNADLYVRFGQNPGSGCSWWAGCEYDYSDTGSGNSESVTISDPSAGVWYIGVYNSGSRKLAGNDISATALSSIEVATPTGRSQEAELHNIATWYSYYRSRMKAAKAGASEAFSGLDGKVRVGFRSIHNRNTFNIPVNDGNDGRFVDNTDNPATPENEGTSSRSTWYARLHGAAGSGGTPLRKALDDAGQYFMDATQGGPYGPQRVQYSCRQNFSILTTDGYWNAGAATHATGNVDNTSGSLITGPNNQSDRYEPAVPYSDGHSSTLADVAMYYWNRDLRDDLTNNVPKTGANPAFWQHMVTFGISIGLRGELPYTSVADVHAAGNFTWPQPGNDRRANIDDLLHAAVNGRGAFVSASNPSEFTAGLREALSAIQQRTTSYSNVATNSVSLDSDTMTFSASYVAGTWTGAVNARRVSRSGVSDTIAWVSTIPSLSNRKVFTTTGSAGATFPTTTQETALARGGGRANFAVSGEDNAKYIKGETRLEDRRGTSNLRNRIATVLGDIVGSSPAYVKDTNTLYVGANDGMLHAFDAATGQELFAYVPGIININDLATLSRGDYFHKWFVDGPIVVSSKALTSNRNILIGALGKGGRGLFALDVTSPATATAANLFKWELAETSGRNMGLVMGRPVLGSVNGTAVAVVGNGINSQRDRAVLLVINAETGAVVREIDTGVGSESQPNGLSAPVGVFGADGKTLRYVYAGDMRGNVWKFDLTSATSTATRIFTAGIGTSVQPISGGLTVAIDPRTRKRWIFFGTGRFLTVEDADATATTVQSMYGIIEGDTPPTRANLTRRTVAVTGATSDGYEVRAFEAKAPLPDDSRGWYIDLPGSGERIVQDAQRVSNILVTASMIPTGDACEASGTGYINALDAFTGTSAGSSFFDLDGDGTTTDQTAGGNPVGSVNYGVGMPTLPNILRGQLVVSGTGVGGDETSGAGKGQGSGITALRWDRVSWREIRSE